ncbi:efflux RND transporter permease subunit [Bythopirellula goksoeyrii]|uniref:Cobalt-zinc-cadmium resistance protein CzcA n=1 Tax=Bythopirellula goksoeyrii TaxID=1400387 RepID=A0A5B9QDI1_9BACT|nr:CusA/CzcA family heavy metal efflux RND transporter [Bythopirellula goksoeyrii]QEG35859.1 Cobalt-zinc-cadmium resistance protein CzcA [Bythopirellula goksoeyrii]
MISKLIQFSIRNRMLIVLATFGMGALGIYNFTRLPIDAVPDITNVQVQINTSVPALSPVEIEKRITFPIETAMSGLPFLSELRSISRYGLSQVTVVFDDNADLFLVRQLVGERLVEAKEALPQGMGEPAMGPISTGLGEIFMWAVEVLPGAVKPDGSEYTSMDLRTIQDWIIRPQLLNVPGVTEVNSIGGFAKQFHVTPYPQKLVAYGLTFQDVLEALEKNNSFAGGGYIEHQGEQYIVRTSGLVKDVEGLRNVRILTRDGTPLFIKDVARVDLGKELRTGAATLNGEEAVVGTTMMLIGENSRTVAHAVAAQMETINTTLPEGVVARTLYNRTSLVDATIHTVQKNLVEGALLVIVILFCILGNFKVALIVALAIPLSMLFAVTGMVNNRISGNLLSLGAIDFGIIVDGSVVMAENIIRRFAERQHSLRRTLTRSERFEETFAAAKEVASPVLSGVGIIMIVYLPILTLTGVEGKMFVPMAKVVLLALFGALVLSFTFVPAMIAIFLTGKVSEEEGAIVGFLKRHYKSALSFSLRQRTLVGVLAATILITSVLLGRSLGSEFVPSLDEHDLAVQALRIPATSLSESIKMQKEVEKALLKFPEVELTFARIGTAEVATDPMPPNIADGYVIIKPRSEWPNPSKSKSDLIAEIEEVLEEIPGNAYEFSQPIELRFNELISGVRSDVAVKIFGDDLDVLLEKATEVSSLLNKVEGASDVKVEQVSGLPSLFIDINNQAIARYGLDVVDVQNVVAMALGGKEAGLIFEGDQRFDIVVRLPEEMRQNINLIGQLPIPLKVESAPESQKHSHSQDYSPSIVPLNEVATVSIVEGANQVSRENAKRRIVAQANIRGRDMGSFVEEATELIEKNIKLPAGYWYKWGGQFENLARAKTRLKIVVPVALLLIFIILFSTFNSIRNTLVIFSGIPFALTGGVMALVIRGIPFSISAGVGFIALSGVAVLNGVVMVSFIRQLIDDGMDIEQAVTQGALTRLRPVIMTALVASIGFIPMAIATGTGSEVQRPLATVVIGGIISSTVLTLLVLPMLFSVFYRDEKDIKI